MIALTHRLIYRLWRSFVLRVRSYEALLSKLPHPLKDLVPNAQADAGKIDTDKQKVVSWIDKVAAGDVVKSKRFSIS